MKFVVTGAAGHVSKPLTERLLKKGHEVTVVGRSPKNLEGLAKLGAKTAIGDMGDVPFFTETFKGADGVYLMLPPMWDSCDQKKQSIQYAENFSSAIRANGVKNAVFLRGFQRGGFDSRLRKEAASIRLVSSDAQWERVAPLLPGKPGDPGRLAADNRRQTKRKLV